MSRLTRAAIGVALAMGMVTSTAAPAGATAYPRPLRQQWWFTTWDIQNKVWPITQGKGVIIAVLDSGVQASLPELRGAVLPGIDARSGSGDGRTDTQPAAITGPETGGHGTGMATLIAAQGRGTGFVGVAPAAKILPVVTDSTDSLIVSIKYAVDHGAKVINISQGGGGKCPDELQQTVSYAIQHDVVVVAAAGNSGHESNASESPANCAGVLAIGGVDFKFRPFVKTQRQPYVAAAAPATQVGSILKDGRYHTSEGGTSSATALTSAAAALVRSKFPNMPAREVVQRLIASARDVRPTGKDVQTGYGLIRPWHALVDNVPKTSPNPVFDAYDKWAAPKAAQTEDPEAAARRKKIDDVASNWVGLLVPLGSTAGVLLLVIVVVLFTRSRRKQPMPTAPMPGYPVQGGPPQWGPPQGPPQGPQWGPPQGPSVGYGPPGQPQPPPLQGPTSGPRE